MELTQRQAHEVLQQVESVATTVHGTLAYGTVGPILILWGAVWLVCFALTQFAPPIAGWAWLVGNTVGLTGTVWLGRRACRQPVRSATAARQGRRLFWFWLLLLCYAHLWLAVLWPARADQVGLVLVTVVMFGYVVMGLWLDLWFLLWLGLAVTALAIGGYGASALMPGYLNLWLGLTGGTALLASGLYLTARWR